MRTAAERHDNLKRYVGRMTARFYPELREIAGCKAALIRVRMPKNKPPALGRGLREELAGRMTGLPRQDTLRFSADVLPRLVTSSYSTV